jgi:tripartite-type tricarboxylate transporter receptor subunit TctC
MKYAKTAEARALLKVASDAHSAAVRPYSLPPGVPKDRVRILQKAFMAAMRDPALLKEAKKSNLEITPIDGPTTKKVLANLGKYNPAMISRLKEILLPKR